MASQKLTIQDFQLIEMLVEMTMYTLVQGKYIQENSNSLKFFLDGTHQVSSVIKQIQQTQQAETK